MPTYVYETIPQGNEAVERFEVEQRMSDEPLKVHPVSGAPVRRVIVGGAGFHLGAGSSAASSGSSSSPSSSASGHACGAGCRHRH